MVPPKPPAAWWQEMLEKDTPGQISPCPSLAVQTVSLCWAHQPISSRALNTRNVTKFVLELVGFYLQGTMQQVMLPGCIRTAPGAAAEIRADPAPAERHRPPRAVEVILTVIETVAAVSEFAHARSLVLSDADKPHAAEPVLEAAKQLTGQKAAEGVIHKQHPGTDKRPQQSPQSWCCLQAKAEPPEQQLRLLQHTLGMV